MGAFYVFLIYAVAAVGGVAFLIAALGGWRPKSVPRILLLLAYAPFAVLALSMVREINTTDERNRGAGFIGLTQEALREYYGLYPERFRPKGEDEEAEIDGFAEWFQTYLKERKGNWPEITRMFRFKNGKLLDREGYPVRFALDFNSDFSVNAFGQRVPIDRIPVAPGRTPAPENYLTTLALLCPPDSTIRYQKYRRNERPNQAMQRTALGTAIQHLW